MQGKVKNGKKLCPIYLVIAALLPAAAIALAIPSNTQNAYTAGSSGMPVEININSVSANGSGKAAR